MTLNIQRCLNLYTNCLYKIINKSFHHSSTRTQLKNLSLYATTDAEENLFISPKVQALLTKITGFDVKKIFCPKPITDVESPKYKLVTDEQLEELQEESNRRALKLLEMPPFKKPWNTSNNDELIISNDSEIANFEMDDSSYVFTDISPGIHKRDRMVMIRDKKGVLRRCNREESDLILMLFYPQVGKMFNMPQMFQEQQLEKLLGEHQYEYVLNRACVQFEPDDPNYIRVTQRTYEHIFTTKQFEVLRSTRFFGCMAFYFLIHNKIDALLTYQLSQNRLDDAVSLVQLYHLVHPKSKSAVLCEEKKLEDHYKFIQVYIDNDSKDKVALEVILEAHVRVNTPEQQTASSN